MNFLSALEVTSIITLVRPYALRKKSEIVSAPRIYGFDTGFICFVKGWDRLREENCGILWEHLVLNEFLAYLELSRLPAGALGNHSLLIISYALCGFANPGSLGIMIGGLGTMAPARRDEIVALGLRSILAGTLATCMTGAVVGIIGI